MSLSQLLEDTCVVQEKAENQGATGEMSLTWSEKLAGVKTRYGQVGKSEQIGDYQVTIEDYKFIFELDTDISIADRIVVDGKTLEIKHVATDSSKYYKYAIAKLIQYV